MCRVRCQTIDLNFPIVSVYIALSVEYTALMAVTTVQAWECDLCGYVWLKVAGRDPKQCPSRKCRSRSWNRIRNHVIHPAVQPQTPKPVAEPKYYIPAKYRKGKP